MKQKLLTTIMLALMLVFFGKGVWGQLLVENFDYTIGTYLTANGWTAHSGAGTQPIDVTTGLSFSGYAGSGIGGAANVDNNGEDDNKSLTSTVTSGVVYTAFIVQTQSTNSAGYFLHLSVAPISSSYFFSKVWVNSNGSGIGISGSTAPASYTTITAGTPTLIVVKYDFTINVSSLFVFNSFPSSEPVTANGTYTETVIPANVGTIALRQYNASEKVIVDGIRIATNWADAVTATGANLNPSITNITHTPTLPSSSQTVSVFADVTDSDGNIDVVALHWGTVSGSLSTTIGMSVSSGDTYATDANIPAQTNGTTVYYEIYALDNDAGETTSAEQSYTVTNLAPEPVAHVTAFAAGATTTSAIPLSWTDSDADFYLIKGVEAGGTIADPVDGTAEADGALVYNIAKGAGGTYTFTGLNFTSSYDFKIFPYNGTGTAVNYLTSPTVPEAWANTQVPVETLPYFEDFADCNTILWAPVSLASNRNWACGTGYESINGYGGDVASDDYLISPEFNMDIYSNEILLFESYNQYADVVYPPIELLYTNSYTGDPSTTTWSPLTAIWCPDNGAVWTSSGNIDVTGITGSTIVFAFHYISTGTGGTTSSAWSIDNIDLQEVSVLDPQAFAAASAGTDQINLTFTTNANTNPVVIVYNGDGTFTDPSGAPPVAGQPFAGGTLLYSGIVSPQSHTGLTPEQTVYYKAFSYDGINYSPGLTDNATTDATEPTNHATSFTATTNSSSAITVAWTDAVPASAGYLIKGSDVSYVDIAVPVDGVAEVDALLVKNVAGGVETKQFTGLTALTPYYFKIFPYNGTGGAINYKTDGSVPEATATTTEAPAIPEIVINEVDSDTPGSDVAEFIELYDGGIGNSDLSGFIVVLFNGNTDVSYLTIDLNGYSTDAQGYFMIGSTGMGTPIEIPPGSSGWLQNGQDAVAIYYDAAVNFPNGTAVTITNLVDALVYDTSDADDPGLLVLLNPGELQINESENGASDVQSMQRLPNGTGGQRNTDTYGVTTPTPGAINEYIITDFPYAQSFDGERFAPVGWTNVKTAGPEDPFHDGTWDRQTVGDHPTCAPQSGVGMARYNSYNLETGTKGELATPSITFPNDDYLVSFWMYRNETGYGDMEEGVNVYFNTSNSSTGGTLLGTIYRELNQPPVVVTEGWYQYTFSMPLGAAGSGKYIIFEGFSAWAFNLFIDEVSIEGFPTTNWSGTTDNDWNTAGNWSNGIPGSTSNVTIPAGLTNYPTLPSSGECNNLTIESSTLGDGSLMGQGFLTVNGTTTIQRYTTQAVWHGISGPLDNDDFNSLYFGGTPEVWGLNYIESTNLYDYETDLATDLGDAKGWMVWVGGDTPQTFNFTGDLRGGPVGPVALTNTGPDALHGYNFVGNPYSSAIDWNAASGWTKTNVDAGIWIWNGTNWSTYVTGIGGTNGGSQYVSLAQGFFVQVNAAQGSGTLGMTTDVQVHNGAAFMKSAKSTPSDFIKLKLIDGEKSDESIIHLNPEATEGYDGQFDMHKMFSWNEDHPQLYSTANNFMAINVLPKETVMVPMDVRGLDGNEMTIALKEVTDFSQVYLSDEYTGIQTNLMEMPYTFTYNAGQTDRFTIYFTVVGTTENQLENIRVYSFDQKIRVIIPMELNAHVEVVNMLGQTVRETDAHLGTRDINMDHGGYYLVNITGDNLRVTRKVFIK